ncbi:MAG TPA: RNA methyltransferase [Caulifigura sp.]|nr:RNA methyltransferase [Caulifigura sp.]
MSLLHLKNPHSVLAALEVRPRDVVEVRVPPRTPSDAWREVATQAARRGVAVKSVLPSEKPRGKRDEKSSREGGTEGLVKERQEVALDDLFAGARERPGLWLALDTLQDPHNVGAIFRTAAFFGVRGIVLTKDRSAPMSATVYDVASGGIELVPYHSTNLNQAIEVAKAAGLWTLGTAEEATQDISAIPRDRSWLIVMGNEEQGLRRLVREHCDELCRITGSTGLTSLNVSVATGVVLGLMNTGQAVPHAS